MDTESFVEQHQDLIRSTIRRACLRWRVSGADLEDLESELWIYVLRDNARVLRQFEGRSSLSTYLYRVLHRAASRCIRSRAATRRLELTRGDTYAEFGDASLDESSWPNVLSNGVNDEAGRIARMMVYRAMSRLSPHDQALLAERITGRSFDEIARARGLAVKTVQNGAYRAIASLRSQLSSKGTRAK